ncbi:MAG: ABC transporter permease [Crenarchaeota archaeon]|nr:ABC transporter permease [Thermoproteota archaeon]
MSISSRLIYWLRGALNTLRLVRQSTLAFSGLCIVSALAFIAITAPYIVPYPEDIGAIVHPSLINKPPSLAHPFGTDWFGRDLLTRCLYAARVSLSASLIVVLAGVCIGTIIGLIAGYFGGIVDEVLMRVTDAFLSIPSLILAIAIAAVLGHGITNAIIALSVTWWPWYARLVRGEVINIRNEVYILAARAMGASSWYIMFRHILPNIAGPILVNASMDMGFAILAIASLGFIGLGAVPPTPEWGSMISAALQYGLDYWWELVFPGLMIFIAVLGFNLLGDGLRDLLDPRFRTGRGVPRI